ncbi:hypothetical protein [Cellulomonas wangsupingiae]|uniref:hypothetical protein n=1 Tax=Cellulomonas wangsupingiae TaxID=2968085 RepID=UPI001D0F3FA8|nr:hypothetical protein [Cellulomonas wangsupingiae]MCM0638946.1 hypothetical protein [Cellulomonas wangsupingiae]
MADVRELLDANLHRVFSDRDADARRRVIDDIYTDDVTFTEPEGTVHGRVALAGRASALLGRTPSTFEFVEDGPRYVGTSTGALAWAGAAVIGRWVPGSAPGSGLRAPRGDADRPEPETLSPAAGPAWRNSSNESEPDAMTCGGARL